MASHISQPRSKQKTSHISQPRSKQKTSHITLFNSLKNLIAFQNPWHNKTVNSIRKARHKTLPPTPKKTTPNQAINPIQYLRHHHSISGIRKARHNIFSYTNPFSISAAWIIFDFRGICSQ